MPSPTPNNSGVITVEAQTNTPGNVGTVRVEVYYDPNVGTPTDPSTQPLRNTGSPGRAMRVWNSCPNPTVTTVTDQTTKDSITVTLPPGDLVTPVFARTAAQLTSWGYATRADVRLSISVR